MCRDFNIDFFFYFNKEGQLNLPDNKLDTEEKLAECLRPAIG